MAFLSSAPKGQPDGGTPKRFTAGLQVVRRGGGRGRGVDRDGSCSGVRDSTSRGTRTMEGPAG